MSQIRAIRALGVTFAMDDFGTKYSSLSYLWNFTFDKIKIDRDFMRHLGSAEKAAQILETIISLGKTLELQHHRRGCRNRRTGEVPLPITIATMSRASCSAARCPPPTFPPPSSRISSAAMMPQTPPRLADQQWREPSLPRSAERTAHCEAVRR